MPTTQGTDDFNHAISAAFYDSVFGVPAAVTSPLYQVQPKTLQIVTTGGNIGVRKNITGAPTRAWAAFPFRTPALPTSTAVRLCNFSANGGATIGAIELGAGGMYATLGATIGASTVISIDTWYWIECILDVTTTAGTMNWRMAGTTRGQAAATITAGTVDFHQLLSLAADPSGFTLNYGMWKWGTATSITDWLGEPAAGTPVVANFSLPWDVAGSSVTTVLGDLPTTAGVQRVYPTQTRAPVTTDDQTQGYAIGDAWIYNNQAWWCVANATGAALWKLVT